MKNWSRSALMKLSLRELQDMVDKADGIYTPYITSSRKELVNMIVCRMIDGKLSMVRG